MFFLDKEVILSEVVEENPSLIPLLSRFGIRLGLNEYSAGKVCERAGVDANFFLMVVNTYLNESYFPENQLKSANLANVLDYLEAVNRDYSDSLIPNIESHLKAFLRSVGDEGALKVIPEIFGKFKCGLNEVIREDSENLFPICRKIASGDKDFSISFFTNLKQFDEGLISLLSDIKSVLIRYLTGEFNVNLCYAVIFSLHSLEKDMRRHIKIRNRIVIPALGRLIEGRS